MKQKKKITRIRSWVLVVIIVISYEDAAVCLKVCEELEADGIGEQGLFDLREADELPAEEQPLRPQKTGKGKKGGAK